MCEITIKAKTQTKTLTYCDTILCEKRGLIIDIQ